MKGWLLLLVAFLVGLPAFANLRIEVPYGLKAGRDVQFKVFFKKESGSEIEVTYQATFHGAYPLEYRGAGRYYLPVRGQGYTYQAHISADYQDPEAGQRHSTSEYFSVDSSPDRIELTAPYNIQTGRTYYFKAYGHFGTKRIDLTNDGRWHANRGRMDSWGRYQAPDQATSDTIEFRFGHKWQTKWIQIRN